MPVNTSITFRKGSSSQWNSTNPVLASGEPGYDLTNNILKIGDGVSAWNSLSNHKHSSIDISDFNSSVSGLINGIYQPLLTNPVTGTGTSGYLSRFGSTSGLTNSIVFQSVNGIGINTTTPSGSLDIAGDVYVRGTANNFGTIYLKSSAVADNILKLRADQFGSLFLEAGSSPYLKLGNQDGIADLRAGASQLTIGHSYNRGGANAAFQYISFNPANIERVRITHAGNFGIGTTTPSGQLHVVGTGIVSSRLGIGNTNPQYTLDVSGSGNFNNLAISGTPIAEVIDDEVANLLVAGSGITLSYNDNANTLTVDANVSTSLVAGSGISLNYNISTDELSIGLSSPIFVSGNNFGIGTSSPSSALDINSDSLRIRTSRTPASAAASGNVGDICWDANYLYVCVATNTWKRSAITTW